MVSESNIKEKGRQPESLASRLNVLTDDGVAPGISDPRAGHGKDEEVPTHVPSGFPTPVEEREEMVIAYIRATDVALGLQRIPAGFYILLRHGALEWRTENKASTVEDDVVEWSGPIPILSDTSATICFEVYASFEFQPMLGEGEQLQQLTITVAQLLDHSAKRSPFGFFAKDGDIVSPCSSVFVNVKRRTDDNSDAPASTVLLPPCPKTAAQGELENATDRGHSAISRYRKLGDKQDLESAVAAFECALDACPVDQPCRAAALSNLAMAKFILSQLEDSGISLGVPLGLYRDALVGRPVGHVDRPSTLIRLALVHVAQLKVKSDEVEREQTEALLREAIELSSIGSHENRCAVFLIQLLATCGRAIDPLHVDGQPRAESHSTSLLTNEDPRTLGVQLMHRFQQFGDLADLQQAIALLEKGLSVRHAHNAALLASLGVALLWRFEHLGGASDLEAALSNFRDSVEFTPHDHPDKPARLSNLGNCYRTRFEYFGDPTDLETAISSLKDAMEFTPQGHPNKPGRLSNLALSFRTRFERFGDLGDLEAAISSFSDAVNSIPHGHPNKPACLGNLGNSLVTRFGHLGDLSDLEIAISNLNDAVDTTPHGHPYKPTCLGNLGTSFLTRFDHLGDLSDLEAAISVLGDAVDLTPHDHPDKFRRLGSLGISLRTRFECLGDLGDLEAAISSLRDAVEGSPHAHHEKPAYLSSLGNCFISRFERLGNLCDLEVAISSYADAAKYTPDGHLNKPVYLSNLGNSFRTRFERLGDTSDLVAAILNLRGAVDSTPDGHPDKPSYLSNLGISFRLRFQHLDDLSDLEAAISSLRDAVDLTPYGHPKKARCLSNLGVSFQTRFLHLGDLRDLEAAISSLTDAVEVTPENDPSKSTTLSNLGACFLRRFGCLENMSDLEAAISSQSNAVNSIPYDHPSKPTCLGNLGNSLRIRFQYLGDLSDLEVAISSLRDAEDLIPHGHPEKPVILSNLGNSFKCRFEHLGDLCDLEAAISSLRDAVRLTPHGHPNQPACLVHLGSCFRVRFDRLGKVLDLEDAISSYSHAASTPVGRISVRFDASREWISCASRIGHPSLLHAYSVAITFLPQLAWVGLSLIHRYSDLEQCTGLVREAAAVALDSGFPQLAVEWLEQGRSVIWGEILHLRDSYEELSSVHPDHASRLCELSVALDSAGATREKTLSTLSELEASQAAAHHPSLQHEADRQLQLAIDRDKLLREIRHLPGFERFLLPKDFSQLRASAHSGPVVLINAAESRCDALIVLETVDHPIHVPLPNFSLKQATDYQNLVKGFLREARVTRSDGRDGQTVPWDRSGWKPFLAPIWKCIVKPVLDALAFSSPGDLPRIFWCPTGPLTFLPLHAAGFYDTEFEEPGHKVFDFVVSSYIPTLAVLAPSPDYAAPSEDIRLLAVRHPPSDGHAKLPGVVPEMRHISGIIKKLPSPRTTFVEPADGTVEEVLGMMKDADWVHFACHGIQDISRPTQSGLCLAHGRRLKISDIIALSRPRRGLAFLSACQTAMGDKGLSDEAVHIAVGMLFAGYGGVIGTMWSISDRIAPDVAGDVYQYLFRNGGRPDYREAARALHEAVGRLREDEDVSFSEWIPFIHVGF